ncbi:LacI family DNA-binding transcriptional regulator [Sphingomonas morindae]|uniref:LacI family DNA-binding transcriptional regulator n=1 Tax=Sphingomonas morindae TaxID=1541170 RepID=A0ABY4X6G7_9SPHN|nr:LacI family DNA-binding transcriptional regulator [Sphingomonas morindae]USI72435.1 LacI family DNA-binding transcriptional regulator [Sphingomonas morindae]
MAIVTIKDVAERVGVSAKTVSRVINGEPHVRAALREQVERVVAELGYRPNAHARSLSSARSYLLAMLFDDPSSGYAIAMQQGAMAQCRARSYHLLVERLDAQQPRFVEELADTAAALRLDGVILPPPLCDMPELLDAVERLGLPYVRVSPAAPGARAAPSLGIDEEAAAAEMVRHLIALGHRAIAFVAGDPVHASAARRRSGFVAAMTAAGLSARAIKPGDFTFRAGLAAGEALLGRRAPPSAIFAANDDMALGVLVAALRRGLAVPEQLSVAGFDDGPTARIAWPALTTIRQPTAEMGAAAVDLLIDRAAGDHHALLDFALVERDSTAAPGPARAG